MSCDSQLRIDGTLQAHLFAGFPERSSSPYNCDVVLVPVTTWQDYRFNPRLLDFKKPYVLLDFTEMEHNYFDLGSPTMLFGKNAKECRWLTPHWHHLDNFVRENPPILYLKRELLAVDESDTVKPCDWPCRLEIPAPQTEDQFNERPIDVFHCWGFSHPSRPILHAAIFHAMTTHGIGVISESDQFHEYFKSPAARTWASIFAPHYARRPITTIEWYQERSKMSVSLPGCGAKCFRMAEAPVGTIMAMMHDKLAWSYDWIDGVNCIRVSTDNEKVFTDLDAATRRPDLYQIYLASQDTVRKYQTKPYCENYILPLIEARL
jgi:hypothetical protein